MRAIEAVGGVAKQPFRKEKAGAMFAPPLHREEVPVEKI
jgi:hypothetical protein